MLGTQARSTAFVTILLAAGTAAQDDFQPPVRLTRGTVGEFTRQVFTTPITSRGCPYEEGSLEGQVAAVGTGWLRDACTSCTCLDTGLWRCYSQMCPAPQ